MTLKVPVAARVSGSERLRAFITLFKLRIFSLLWAESIIGLVLASGLSVDAPRILLLTAAGFLSTAGANALNNYFDRDIDAIMKRTSTRPVPSKKVLPREALNVGIVMGTLGVCVALFGLSQLSGAMVAAGLVTYAFVYTYLLKRRTSWNVVIGGASGSFAFLAGWTAVAPVNLEAFLIGMAIFLWTPSHFWALAIKGVEQYEGAGVPMLPVVAGVMATSKAIMINSVALVASSLSLYAFGYFGYVYLGVAVILGSLLLFSDYLLMVTNSAAMAWRAYKFTALYLLILSLAMVADKAAAHVLAAL